jgi:hypothetical protein
MSEGNYTREMPKEITKMEALKIYLNIIWRWALYWLILAMPIGFFAKLVWTLVKFGWNIL